MNGFSGGALQKVQRYVTHDIWSMDHEHGSWQIRYARLALKWIIVTGQGVIKDRVFLRASALTYTSILSIVPFLAVGFSVLKGVGFQNMPMIHDLLSRVFAGREEVADTIITYVNNTNVRALGIVGVAVLFFTVVNLLSNIEKTFNDMWGVTRSRSIARKTADYISVSILFPILIVTAISLTATLENYWLVKNLLSVSLINQFYMLLLKLTPFAAAGLALMFLYMFIPNTRVRFWPALGAGVVAGAIWQLAQWAYVTFQFGFSKYNAIYGSFAQLPLFLIWVYVSWVIVLVGAELCYAFQNLKTVEKASRFSNISMKERQLAGLSAAAALTRAFYSQNGAPSLDELAQELDLPENLLTDALETLRRAGLAGQVERDEQERFVLLQPPERVRAKDVLEAFLKDGAGGFDLVHSPDFKALEEALRSMDAAVAASEGNKNLVELAGIERSAS